MKVSCAGILSFLLMSQASAQNGPGTTVSFEGIMEVLQTSSCNININVGDSARIAYRFKNSSTDPSDAITIYFPESTYRLFSNDATGSLNGNVQSNEILLNPYAGYIQDNSGSSDLVITQAGGSVPIPNVNNIKIGGTINNAYFQAGCTLTIRALLTKKPIQ